MKLYLLSQDANNDYDTYDSCVVAAESEEDARLITPNYDGFKDGWSSWVRSPDQVEVQYIGEAAEGAKAGVVCASFNAG